MQDQFSLSQHIADTITSPYNQHVSIICVGNTGQGKSNAMIRLAYNIANDVARIKGGHWSKYFSVDNIAVITQDEILRVMEIQQKYAVILLDDISVGYSARSWQKKENKVMNDIITTFRTDNTCLIMTLPNDFMVDKIARNLNHMFIELEMAIFKRKVTFGKVFELSRHSRQNKTYYQYPVFNGHKSVRVGFRLPPKEIRDQYELKRHAIALELKENSLSDYEEMMAERNGEITSKSEKPQKVTKKDRILEINRDVQAGIYPNLKEGLKANNMSSLKSYAHNVISNYS